MRVTIISTLLLIVSTYASAQQRDIISDLPAPNSQGAKVTIINPSNITTNRGKSDATIRAYRIRIYFDNSQNARSGSEETVMKFKELYPSTPTFTEYTAPYFKVTAGNFLTREEAIILWGKIINIFPNAFVVGETIPLSEFTACSVLDATRPSLEPDSTTVAPPEEEEKDIEE